MACRGRRGGASLFRAGAVALVVLSLAAGESEAVRTSRWLPSLRRASAWPEGLEGKQWSPTRENVQELWGSLKEQARASRADPGALGSESGAGAGYFGFIPKFLGTVSANGTERTLTFEGECFKETKVIIDTKAKVGTDEVVRFELKGQKSLFPPCTDAYFLTSGDGFKVVYFYYGGSHEVKWPTGHLTSLERWYVTNRGFHLFQFPGWEKMAADVAETAELFLPALTNDAKVREIATDERELDFLQRFAGVDMQPRRSDPTPLAVNESLVGDGDFLGILRLDGLDPMIAWGIGSTIGHTAVARRDASGTLLVCESQTKSAYWPDDNVQCHEWARWMQLAHEAGYHVVWAPLSAKYRAKFDAAKAQSFVDKVLGYSYGFHNFLFSFVDTERGNYPCLPPDYDTCLTWKHLEVLGGFVDKEHEQWADLMWTQAMNLRMGTKGLRTIEIVQNAMMRGMDPAEVAAMPEQDSWVYNTTKQGEDAAGPAMTCSVFVCHVWKAAGLFDEVGSEVNCGEFTPWDDYSLDIFAKNFAFPAECHREEGSDPKVCQLMGQYTLRLNDFGTKQMRAHMAERCPGKAPDYERPADC